MTLFGSLQLIDSLQFHPTAIFVSGSKKLQPVEHSQFLLWTLQRDFTIAERVG